MTKTNLDLEVEKEKISEPNDILNPQADDVKKAQPIDVDTFNENAVVEKCDVDEKAGEEGNHREEVKGQAAD